MITLVLTPSSGTLEQKLSSIEDSTQSRNLVNTVRTMELEKTQEEMAHHEEDCDQSTSKRRAPESYW